MRQAAGHILPKHSPHINESRRAADLGKALPRGFGSVDKLLVQPSNHSASVICGVRRIRSVGWVSASNLNPPVTLILAASYHQVNKILKILIDGNLKMRGQRPGWLPFR